MRRLSSPLEEEGEFSEKVEQRSSPIFDRSYLPYKLKERGRERLAGKGCMECKLSNFISTLIPTMDHGIKRSSNTEYKGGRGDGKREE